MYHTAPSRKRSVHSRLPERLPASQFAVQKTGRADQRQMTQGLRCVAQMPRVTVELFGIQPQRVGVTQQLLELQMRLLDPPGTGQTFHVPERAGHEGALFARQAVIMIVVVAVAEYHAIAHQRCFDGIQRRQPLRIIGPDKAHQRHQQHGRIKVAAALVLHKVAQFFVPEVLPNVVLDIFAHLVPAFERPRQRTFQGQAQSTIQRHPAHQPRMQKVLIAAAHFPNAHIAVIPVLAHVIYLTHHMFPAFMGDCVTVLVGQVNGVHQLAVDVQLDLLVRFITNTHWLRTAVAGEVIEMFFGQLGMAVEGIQNAELLGLFAAVIQAPTHPAHERIGFFGVAQAHERINGERCVTDPGVTVIPVTFATLGFRQAKCRCSDDAAMLARGQQLERQRRTGNHFTPAALVLRLASPTTPEFQRVVEITRALARCDIRVVDTAKNELDGLAFVHLKLSDRVLILQMQWRGSRQAHARLPLCLETDVLAVDARVGFSAAVVHAHAAAHADRRLAKTHLHATYDTRQVFLIFANRHQVSDFHHRIFGNPAGLQHVGVGQVNLQPSRIRQIRRQLKDSGVIGVEQRGKDRRAVEVRPATEVDTAGVGDQRCTAHVTDDAVILDAVLRLFRKVSHCHETPGKGSYHRR
ncbi:hypothetical protein ALP72_05644 [Pseudomonas coronafaciens pv. coronafaciens]|nr:hypothetical protein ALP72_05644 [Pseudomonas coronafaciens pv. coronafaciens]